MKKILLCCSMLLSIHASHSQVIISLLLGDQLNTGKIEFGLEGGLNFSNIHGLDQSKSLTGFNLGFYFDFKLKNPQWMFNTGVIVKSPMGARGLPVYSLNDPDLDNAFSGGTVTTKLRYFNVPATMKYVFKNHFYLKSGIQLGLLNNAFDEFTNSVATDDDLTYKLKRKDQYHPLDAGLVLGFGYRLMRGNGMNLGIQYYHGLVDVLIDDSSPGQMNRSFYMTVGIPIDKGKAQKKDPQKTE